MCGVVLCGVMCVCCVCGVRGVMLYGVVCVVCMWCLWCCVVWCVGGWVFVWFVCFMVCGAYTCFVCGVVCLCGVYVDRCVCVLWCVCVCVVCVCWGLRFGGVWVYFHYLAVQ